jgi:hypothetical protein
MSTWSAACDGHVVDQTLPEDSNERREEERRWHTSRNAKAEQEVGCVLERKALTTAFYTLKAVTELAYR